LLDVEARRLMRQPLFTPRRPGLDSRSGLVGFMVDKVVLGQDFIRVLLFPLLVLIPPTASQASSSIIRGWNSRPNSHRLILTPP
jgi:hypothetical protein